MYRIPLLKLMVTLVTELRAYRDECDLNGSKVTWHHQSSGDMRGRKENKPSERIEKTYSIKSLHLLHTIFRPEMSSPLTFEKICPITTDGSSENPSKKAYGRLQYSLNLFIFHLFVVSPVNQCILYGELSI